MWRDVGHQSFDGRLTGMVANDLRLSRVDPDERKFWTLPPRQPPSAMSSKGVGDHRGHLGIALRGA
jgi:hypothetical protein